MKNPVKLVYKSAKEALSKRNYLIMFLIIFVLIIIINILIPVFTIPGNTILFQLSIFGFKDYLVLVPISFLVSLMITMQVYSYKKRKSLKEVGKSVVGGSSGLVAGVFGTASCSSCIAVLFGFLGLGTVYFLIKYQWYVVGISAAIVLLALYLTSLNIEKNCGVC